MAFKVIIKVVPDEAALKDMLREDWFRRSAMSYASRVTAIARTTAPHRTGRGAASIHGEAESGPDGWEVHVSWDGAHGYMRYQRSHAVQEAAYQVLGR